MVRDYFIARRATSLQNHAFPAQEGGDMNDGIEQILRFARIRDQNTSHRNRWHETTGECISPVPSETRWHETTGECFSPLRRPTWSCSDYCCTSNSVKAWRVPRPLGTVSLKSAFPPESLTSGSPEEGLVMASPSIVNRSFTGSRRDLCLCERSSLCRQNLLL